MPSMRTVKCPKCGEEILVVPDDRKMAKALNNHVETHDPADHEELHTYFECELLRLAAVDS